MEVPLSSSSIIMKDLHNAVTRGFLEWCVTCIQTVLICALLQQQGHIHHRVDNDRFLTTHLLLAPLRMAPVSNISAMKVLTPLCWQSPAPTRAKIASRGAIRALSAGMKQPTWVMSTRQPTYSNNRSSSGSFVKIPAKPKQHQYHG